MGAALLQSNGMAAVVTMRIKTPGIGGAKPGTKQISNYVQEKPSPCCTQGKDMNNLLESKSLQALTDLVRAKIDGATGKWEKPFKWIENAMAPKNVISNTCYSGFNTFLLALHSDFRGYPFSGWATFKQYTDNGICITKGTKGVPVMFWNMEYIRTDNPKERITPEDWVMLPENEREQYKQRISCKEYTVFNVAQTNMQAEKPDLYAKIAAGFDTSKKHDDAGMYENESLDRMIQGQTFICPIKVTNSNEAFYNVTFHSITVPLKSQFSGGELFYSTLAHECAHATKVPLKREGGKFGSAAYAREELVAEIAAALTGMQLGFSTTIENHNAQYLKNWESALKDEDKKSKTFLYEVVKDAVKASEITCNCAIKNAASAA